MVACDNLRLGNTVPETGGTDKISAKDARLKTFT